MLLCVENTGTYYVFWDTALQLTLLFRNPSRLNLLHFEFKPKALHVKRWVR